MWLNSDRLSAAETALQGQADRDLAERVVASILVQAGLLALLGWGGDYWRDMPMWCVALGVAFGLLTVSRVVFLRRFHRAEKQTGEWLTLQSAPERHWMQANVVLWPCFWGIFFAAVLARYGVEKWNAHFITFTMARVGAGAMETPVSH